MRTGTEQGDVALLDEDSVKFPMRQGCADGQDIPIRSTSI
jgi:hypothetical protein